MSRISKYSLNLLYFSGEFFLDLNKMPSDHFQEHEVEQQIEEEQIQASENSGT